MVEILGLLASYVGVSVRFFYRNSDGPGRPWGRIWWEVVCCGDVNGGCVTGRWWFRCLRYGWCFVGLRGFGCDARLVWVKLLADLKPDELCCGWGLLAQWDIDGATVIGEVVVSLQSGSWFGFCGGELRLGGGDTAGCCLRLQMVRPSRFSVEWNLDRLCDADLMILWAEIVGGGTLLWIFQLCDWWVVGFSGSLVWSLVWGWVGRPSDGGCGGRPANSDCWLKRLSSGEGLAEGGDSIEQLIFWVVWWGVSIVESQYKGSKREEV